ncbi:MAG: MBL fold metallo-hydrolase [Acidimicrobiia bacterium]|nr:MBL fold metallo-hydrolase [Acidimicrobiia bacterium]
MRFSIVLANNPSAYTGPGTNTYVLEFGGKVVVIDPGPIMPDHIDNVAAAIGEREVGGVLVTHHHPDHAPAAESLADRFTAPVFAMDPVPPFKAKRLISDEMDIEIGGEVLTCIHSPGHTNDSVTFVRDGVGFIGDVLMGESTVIIEDLTAYLDTLERLSALGLDALYPGHGPVIEQPRARLHEVIEHRLARNDQIVSAIETGADTVEAIRALVYPGLNPALHIAAEGSVRTHLSYLMDEGTVPNRNW